MKHINVIAFSILIAFIAIFYIATDWISFLGGVSKAGSPVLLAGIGKWAMVLLCACFVRTRKKEAWNQQDWRDMSWIFTVILLADTFLELLGILNLEGTLDLVRVVMGVICFFIAQVLLIKRNRLKLKESLTGIRIINQSSTWIFYTPAILLLALSFYNYQKE